MSYLRALVFGAPAALVLGGSLSLSRFASPSRTASPSTSRSVSPDYSPPSSACQFAMERSARRREVVIDLLDGRLDFTQAVGQFRDIERMLPLPHEAAGLPGVEVTAMQVLGLVRAHDRLAGTPNEEAMRWIEHQAAEWRSLH